MERHSVGLITCSWHIVCKVFFVVVINSTESFKVIQKGWPCLFCYTSQIWNQVLNIQGHQLWGLICVILSNCWFAVEADVGIKWVLCGLGLRVGKKVPSSAAKPGLDSKSSYWCWKKTRWHKLPELPRAKINSPTPVSGWVSQSAIHSFRFWR